MEIRREAILQKATMDLTGFFESRFSVRQFSPKPVPRGVIEKAIRMAQKSPSVCNRQSVKVYAFDQPAWRERVLACQRGNAGFGQELQVVLVVTSDVKTFFSAGERNQCWIDGGLFSMSLVYALHSLGVGSICLNWSAEMEEDEELHRVAGIPEGEAVIMFIGVGFLPEKLVVAQSRRKPLGEVLIWGGRQEG
jgi:nitroreductase